MSRGVVFGPTCCDRMVLHWAISLKTNSRQCWLAPEVAIMTTLDVVCDDNVGIMTNLGVQWLFKTPKFVVCGRYEASTQREERVSYFLSWIWTFDYITKYYCDVWHRNCRSPSQSVATVLFSCWISLLIAISLMFYVSNAYLLGSVIIHLPGMFLFPDLLWEY